MLLTGLPVSLKAFLCFMRVSLMLPPPFVLTTIAKDQPPIGLAFGFWCLCLQPGRSPRFITEFGRFIP